MVELNKEKTIGKKNVLESITDKEIKTIWKDIISRYEKEKESLKKEGKLKETNLTELKKEIIFKTLLMRTHFSIEFPESFKSSGSPAKDVINYLLKDN